MKNIDKKRKVQLFIIFMITIALLAGSVTYALIELNIIYRGNQENTISSCSFNIDIKENNPINLVSTYPMDDNEATKLEPYKFSITPNSQTCSKLQYNITIVSNCDTCTKTNGICNDNNLCNCNEGYQIDPNLIKYEITNKTTGEKTVGINPYKMGVAGSMTVGTTINFELKMWIINSATNDDLYIKENGSYKEDSNGLILTKNFCSKVKITGTDTPYLTPPTAVDTLIKLTNNQNDSGLYTITHPADSTLQIGATNDITEYRYRGASPKNYVTFNNETWRIIGIFPTDDGTGKIENRVKLIRDESIGDKYWNNCIDKNRDFICDDTNKAMNDWTGATLNTYLNGTYLNSLDSTSKSLISNAKYYLGGLGIESNDEQGKIKVGQTTGIQLYNYERKMQNGNCSYNSDEGCYLGTGCYYYGTNPNSFTEKLGLMYSSDYFYASENCENKMMFEFDSNTGDIAETSTKDIRACNTTNWLYNLKVDELHLPQLSVSPRYALYLVSDGVVVEDDFIFYKSAVRPVLYLTSFTQITGGNGTIGSPYTLGL